MTDDDRLFALQCVADLAGLTNQAGTAALRFAIKTKTKGTQPRFLHMRDKAEEFYTQLRREA